MRSFWMYWYWRMADIFGDFANCLLGTGCAAAQVKIHSFNYRNTRLFKRFLASIKINSISWSKVKFYIQYDQLKHQLTYYNRILILESMKILNGYLITTSSLYDKHFPFSNNDVWINISLKCFQWYRYQQGDARRQNSSIRFQMTNMNSLVEIIKQFRKNLTPKFFERNVTKNVWIIVHYTSSVEIYFSLKHFISYCQYLKSSLRIQSGPKENVI